MLSRSNLILTTPPTTAGTALTFGLPVGHMAYRIGSGPHLFRANMPISVRGGLMVVDDASCDGRGNGDAFCQEVIRECVARGFDGVIFDFERRPMPLLQRIVHSLAPLMARRGWSLYVPESYGRDSDVAKVIISSALSGGSLTERLKECVGRYGADRVVLGVERVAEDFFLPSPKGQGVPLSREELVARIKARGPSIFFSRELCAHYFTYMSRESGAHFILFDDAASIRKKLEVASGLGVRTAILAFPQVDDLLPAILA